MLPYTESAPLSVFTSVATTEAYAPLVSHIFCPLRTNSPEAERVAFDRIAATSEPHPGSDIENAPRTSPVAIRGSNDRFCSAEPCCATR
jgi:hypothetical protein